MGNPFIEKAKKQKENPFIAKAQIQDSQKRKRQQNIAKMNYDFLRGLLERYTDDDDQQARERIRKRTQQAKEALDSYS